jgi:hypothetical protein
VTLSSNTVWVLVRKLILTDGVVCLTFDHVTSENSSLIRLVNLGGCHNTDRLCTYPNIGLHEYKVKTGRSYPNTDEEWQEYHEWYKTTAAYKYKMIHGSI